MFAIKTRSPSALTEEAFPTIDGLTLSPNDRHQIQLETYHRDPKKLAASSRIAKSPLSEQLSVFVEESDDTGKSKKPRAPTYYLLQLEVLRSWRKILGILGAAGAIILVLQILSAPVDPNAEWDSWSQEQKIKPSMRVNRKAAHKKMTKSGSSMLGDHKTVNGILKVNPDSAVHPIKLLVEEAQRTWNDKITRQSKTLRAAVDEYIRRYGQNPPKGFEKWWAYVVENNVPLPDEYDQIHRDLAPFYSVSPGKLNHRLEEASRSLNTFTLEVKNGEVNSYHSYDHRRVESGEERPKHQVALIQPIAHHLPDMKIVISVHDTPLNMISWQHRMELVNRDKQEGFIDDDVDPDAVNGYPWACPISSPLFNAARHIKTHERNGLTDIEGKSFISDLREYMNICNHPELMGQHGLLIGKNPPMQSPSPVISLSKTALHADILGVPTEQWVKGGPVPVWEDRKYDKVLWRGSNTAMHYDTTVNWRNSQRMRLNNLTNHAGIGQVVTLPPTSGKRTLGETASTRSWSSINEEQMDIAFTGKPLQCDERDGTCDQIGAEYAFSESRMNHQDALQYKYVVDVDGNAWSARFNRLLTSGSLIMKATIMPEWYSDRIQPWVHFVPLKLDFSDLYDVVAYFRPSPSNPYAEDVMASTIAAAGRQWALTHWRREDMTAYVFRLYLEWARLLAPNRKSMDFVYSAYMEITRA
ncbi:uncharacterized protein L201_008127 [Kwoniella dendrophila CBS 6074]|uniref:Glycosyl transferase CAP10 domain-containing protein n=1 Tax=Kwoniella dendrophila CBS 6074 TaxID=1295534 RepID=A0AAX4K7P4_9TREE